MTSVYIMIGVFAVMALILKIQWLFLSMLLLVAALAVGEALTHPAPRVVHHKKEEVQAEMPNANFLDNVISNAINVQNEATRKRQERGMKPGTTFKNPDDPANWKKIRYT